MTEALTEMLTKEVMAAARGRRRRKEDKEIEIPKKGLCLTKKKAA